MVTGGDNALGFVTPSHTKICAVYCPGDLGAHDWLRLMLWLGASDPVIHERETAMPLESCTCTRYANAWFLAMLFVMSDTIPTCCPVLMFSSTLPVESTSFGLPTVTLSRGGNVCPTVVVASIFSWSEGEAGSGSVLSVYSPVMVSPSETCSLFPEDGYWVAKSAVPWKMPDPGAVSVMVSLIPPESEVDHTLASNLLIASGLMLMSGSVIWRIPCPSAG